MQEGEDTTHEDQEQDAPAPAPLVLTRWVMLDDTKSFALIVPNGFLLQNCDGEDREKTKTTVLVPCTQAEAVAWINEHAAPDLGPLVEPWTLPKPAKKKSKPKAKAVKKKGKRK